MKLRLLVIGVIGFIAVTSFAQNELRTEKELTLEDAVMGQYRQFYPKHSTMVEWIPGTDNYSFLSGDYQTLKMAGAKKGKSIDLMNTAELNKATGVSFPYFKLEGWIDENTFYTSNDGKYFIVNAALKTAKGVTKTSKEAENSVFHSKTNSVAYTIENNLFIANGKDQHQITEFGSEIVSGHAIARSEFGISGGIFWSNSGDYLGFYQKDESEVADYPLLDITTPTGSLNSIKYPMAGQASEKSAVGIYNLKTKKTVYIKPTGNPDDYLTNFAWGPNDKYVYVAEVNRDQNHTKLLKYHAESGRLVATLLEEQNDKWTEPENPVCFVNDNQFIWMSEKDGFMNLYLYNDEGKLIKQLTKNKWVTQGIDGHNDESVFFHGTGDSPLETNYFKVDLTSGKQTQLTQGGTHSVTFSSDYTYLFDEMSNTTTPNIEKIIDAKGKEIRTVLVAENPYEGIEMGTADYGTLKADDGTTDLHYRLIKPSDFDETKKYPVLVYVYGGPHAQLVTNSWGGGASLWMYWMAEQGYLVYTIDGRGSANRGFEFESIIHRQLGKVEMDDQMTGVNYLQSLPYVDGNRMAVHGWSFGGFMTTSLMLRDYSGTFKVGVAGGPVTDWSYYEVMYGERYMDRPEENLEGYATNNLLNYVNKLEGKLLLIHGTSDDVVVMQHNLALVKAFVEEGVQMDFFPYPMHKHNVRGKDRVHLMRKVLTYVLENNK